MIPMNFVKTITAYSSSRLPVFMNTALTSMTPRELYPGLVNCILRLILLLNE